MAPTDGTRGVDRRRLIKRASGAAVLAWSTPAIVDSLTAPAAAMTCTCTPAAVSIVPSCRNDTLSSGSSCVTYYSNTVTVCRGEGQSVRFSRNSGGNQEPYFDELAVLSVTSPLGVTVVRNFIRWQNDCRDPAGSDVALSSANQCGSTSVPALNITSMFGSECGNFSVTIRIRNRYTPYGWSTAWIVPV